MLVLDAYSRIAREGKVIESCSPPGTVSVRMDTVTQAPTVCQVLSSFVILPPTPSGTSFSAKGRFCQLPKEAGSTGNLYSSQQSLPKC